MKSALSATEAGRRRATKLIRSRRENIKEKKEKEKEKPWKSLLSDRLDRRDSLGSRSFEHRICHAYFGEYITRRSYDDSRKRKKDSSNCRRGIRILDLRQRSFLVSSNPFAIEVFAMREEV